MRAQSEPRPPEMLVRTATRKAGKGAALHHRLKSVLSRLYQHPSSVKGLSPYIEPEHRRQLAERRVFLKHRPMKVQLPASINRGSSFARLRKSGGVCSMAVDAGATAGIFQRTLIW